MERWVFQAHHSRIPLERVRDLWFWNLAIRNETPQHSLVPHDRIIDRKAYTSFVALPPIRISVKIVCTVGSQFL